MKGLQLHSEDLHEGIKNEANPTTGFDAMEEEEQGIVVGEHKEIWLEERGQEDLLDVNDASIFYGDFPPLPDFPCMSSSSSSSSTWAPVKPMTSSSSCPSASSSSSAASWAVLKSEAEEDIEKRNFYDHHSHHDHHDNDDNDDQNDRHDDILVLDTSAAATISSTGSMAGGTPQPSDHQTIGGVHCMDVMENFGFMDLLESNDFFDPASIFHTDDTSLLEELQIEKKQPPQEQQPHEEMTSRKNDDQETTQQGGGNKSDDLAMVFLEWLKSNKESVSADDLRRVKLKKSTIECAAKRLGGGKEGMKQLLKLILEWVQTNHLQRRRIMGESSSSNNINPHYQYYQQEPLQNPNLNCNSIQLPDHQSNPCFNQSPWNIVPPPYVSDPGTMMPAFPSMVGYMGDPFSNVASNIKAHPNYPNPADYNQMLDSSPSWPPSSQFALASQYTSFADPNNLQPAQAHPSAFTGYGNQYLYQYLTGHGDNRLAKLGSSATKEARKKRMARQRRFLSHHRNHHNNPNPNQSAVDPHARVGNDNCAPTGQANNAGNFVYWPTPGGAGSASVDAPAVDRSAMQTQNYRRQAASDRRQGWKPEKNLRFLLQKVLKQSDVGSLGRIVLPKKEAETHLPELEARDGISIAMEDIGTSRIWNMRYRFWPNNKSRMYLLENTGDFVRTNGLQEGDFIVIYSDVKCGKYLIRGVKVRQPGPKSENKKAGKSQRNSHGNCPAADNNGSTSSTAINQTQRQTQTLR